MWELGDKAKEEGIYLFTYPTTGYFDAFFYALMYSAGGPEFLIKQQIMRKASGKLRKHRHALILLQS